MKINIHKSNKPMTIEQFADKHGLEMQAFENYEQDGYFVYFKYSEIKKENCLHGVCGRGKTIESAIKNYAREISEQLLIIDAYSPQHKEIYVPRLRY